MRTKIFITLFIASIILLFTNCSDNDDEKSTTPTVWTNRVDSLFKAMETNNQGMGSIIVTKNGSQIFSKSTGYLNVEEKIKSTSETKYRIGSVSKTFTAVLVLKAQEEQKLRLDQTLDTYFPTIANASKIKISQLLNHESGIPDYVIDPIFEDPSSYMQARSKEEMIQIIENYKSNFEPGSKIAYSSSNYLLISYILEDIYMKTYKDILKDKITDPLKLKNTYLSEKPKAREDEAFSYFYDGVWELHPEVASSLLLGTGGIVSTPSDLCSFINALFNYKIINEGSLNLMTTLKGESKMGMGIAEVPDYNKQTVFLGHGGLIDAFRAAFLYNPSDRVCIAYCFNGVHDDLYASMNDFMIEKLVSMYESY